MGYLFGDTDLAARRLERLARVFREPTCRFLREAVPSAPALAIDLGCGPGETTHLLAEVLGCGRVVGLDRSESFIALARRTETPRVTFRLHDVTRTPFPVRGADLMLARLLLTHLEEPEGIVERWIGELRPGGRLLIEEPEWIRTGLPLFTRYLSLVESLLRSEGKELYCGARLDRIDPGARARKPLTRVHPWRVANRDAATLFSMNLPSWKDHPFVRARHDAAWISALQSGLDDLARAADDRSDIEWGLRQIVLERLHAR